MKTKNVKLIILLIITIMLFSNVSSAKDDWSDSWEFEYQEEVQDNPIIEELPIEEETTYSPQYEPQAFLTYDILDFGGKAQAVTFIAISTLSFGGRTSIQGNDAPILSNPEPANGSYETLITKDYWNITIEDPDGNLMNWTIEGSQDIGINASTNCLNGSYNISISGNLSYATTYTVWVNATDGSLETNESFTFTTENESVFTIIDTLTFGGKTTVQRAYNIPTVTTNASTYMEETNSTLNGYIADSEGEVCTGYFQYGFDTNYGNTTISQGGLANHTEFEQDATNLNNGSYYHFRAVANNSNATPGYGADAVFLTKPLSGEMAATMYNYTQINLTWAKGDGANYTYIERNTATEWDRGSGTLVCNITGTEYDDWNCSAGITYYYQAWSFTTFGELTQWSDTNASTSNTTQSSLMNITINGSKFIEETNATMLGYINEDDDADTTCYFLLNAWENDFSSPSVNQSVGVKAAGTEFEYNVTLANGTYYYARVDGNNIYTWNNSWNTTTLLTKPQPATSLDTTLIGGGYNITWTHGNGYNESVLVMNQDNWPQHLNDGQLLYQGKNNFYHHTGLNLSDTYYYRVWEYIAYAELYEDSDGNESISRQYTSQLPAFTNPNPANESNMNWNDVLWNITIESPSGNTFNWTIEGEADIGINGSIANTNGSKYINITLGNLTNGTIYTIWVNATQTNTPSDALNWTNETFWFNVSEPQFTPISTLTFGGKATTQGNNPILSDEAPTNESYENDLYPWINITVNDPQSDKMNVTWATNVSGSWVDIAWNTSVDGGTYRQRATWANASYTTYWWQIRVNDTENNWANATYHFTTSNYTWGNWSEFWTFNYTCCSPTDFTATAYDNSSINLTWNICGDGADKNVLIVNESGWTSYPLSPSNGTEIYNGTNSTFNHTGLAKSTTYYYTIWGYNITNNNYSLVNYTDSATTQGDVQVCCPYPPDTSTEITRPPTNLSVRINGTDVEAYIYFWNMTPTTDLWSLVYNWSGVTNSWVSVNELTTNNATTQFIWGNTEYTWSINVTDGTTWTNQTYTYTTLASAGGAGSRNDTNNDNTVNVFDLNEDWTHRTGGVYSYDGLYDVNADSTINVFDLNQIWAGRS